MRPIEAHAMIYPMILVTDGTRFTGRVLMRHLLESLRDVRVMIRASRRTPRLPKWRPIDVAVVSLADERAIQAALPVSPGN